MRLWYDFSMSEKHEIKGWWSYLGSVVLKPIWTLVTTGIIVTLLYVGTWWRDNFGTDEWVKRLQLKHLLPHWNPAWWVCIGLAVVLIVVVKASHRLYANCAQDAISLRKSLLDRQFEPLAVTAPQVRLISETEPYLGPIEQFLLINVSTTHSIFNILFQPVRLENGIFVVWNPNSVAVLQPGERITLRPTVLATRSDSSTGPMDSSSGVDALHQAIRSRSQASNEYDIGGIAFSCEDASQQRYLVTLRVAIDLSGLNMTVIDTNRVRIGSRPSVHPTS